MRRFLFALRMRLAVNDMGRYHLMEPAEESVEEGEEIVRRLFEYFCTRHVVDKAPHKDNAYGNCCNFPLILKRSRVHIRYQRDQAKSPYVIEVIHTQERDHGQDESDQKPFHCRT